MAIEVNNAAIREAIERRGFPEPEPGILHLFGLRGAVPWADSPLGKPCVVLKENQVDEWNDTIGLFGTAFGMWKGTVDPGLPYTLDPLNEQGCAHLQDGCWEYLLGYHKGNEALVQGGPVTVTRDEDRDGTGEPQEYTETGFYGINIHGGSGAHVDEWSAGCQVVWDQSAYGPNWSAFLGAVKEAGQATYRYYLLEATDLET